jgi:hypothetical protein
VRFPVDQVTDNAMREESRAEAQVGRVVFPLKENEDDAAVPAHAVFDIEERGRVRSRQEQATKSSTPVLGLARYASPGYPPQ